MKKFIFITTEGYTYQPNSQSIEPDVENCQVVGFSEGVNSKEAFNRLVEENKYLLEMDFDEVISFQLADTKKEYFCLSNKLSVNSLKT